MTDTPITDEAWQDETTLRDIPNFEANTPELVAARGRWESAELEYQAWLRMARSAKYGTQGARMAADDLLSESMDAPWDAALQTRSESAEADLAWQQARQQRIEAIVNTRGRAARQALDEAAIALRELLVAAPQACPRSLR